MKVSVNENVSVWEGFGQSFGRYRFGAEDGHGDA